MEEGMITEYNLDTLQKEFKDRESFSRDELFAFYRRFKPDLKDTTFRWRLFHLKENKIITPYSKELFSFGYKPTYQPEIADKTKKISSKVVKQFPDLKFCIWSTNAVNEFMLHIPNKYFTVVEVEPGALESVFYFLKDLNLQNVYLQPDEQVMKRYVSDSDSAIVVQSLVSKTPTQKVNDVPTITIEKLIVDLISGKKLFFAYQGAELAHIVNNAYHRYVIDFTKLFSYAKRRRKETEIKEFFLNKTDVPKEILND